MSLSIRTFINYLRKTLTIILTQSNKTLQQYSSALPIMNPEKYLHLNLRNL